MTSNQLASIKDRLTMHGLTDHRLVWNPPGYSQISVPVRVLDVRRVFNRLDGLIHVFGRPTNEQVWVSLETLSGVSFEDLL